MSDNRDLVKKWDLRILSLDGDGPGCLSQLYILEEYMNRLAYDLGVDPDSLLPADYFQVIGGTGFGGWIALLLGRLRLPVSKAIEHLLAIGLKVFPPDEKGKMTPQERSRRLRAAVERTLRSLGVPVDATLQDKETVTQGCNVIVLVVPAVHLDHCRLFCTYSSRFSHVRCTLVEAACATMSTLDHFSPVPIGKEGMQEDFVCASYGFNNPTYEILREVQRHYEENSRISLILSLGSGRLGVASVDSKGVHEQSKLLLRKAMGCEKAAKTLANELKVGLSLRLNVDQGMELIEASNWDKSGSIRSHTGAYLGTMPITEAVDVSLGMLVGKSRGVVGLPSSGSIRTVNVVFPIHIKVDRSVTYSIVAASFSSLLFFFN